MEIFDAQGTASTLLPDIQLCYVQIFPLLSVTPQASASRRRRKDEPVEEPPVVFVRTYNNDRAYLKVAAKTLFGNLVLALLAWQNMRPHGLAKKWFALNRAAPGSAHPHEMLVCRFKVYGPVPAKARSVTLLSGPKPPPCLRPEDSPTGVSVHSAVQPDNVVEGWFYTMGVLRSDGMLHFLTELDGTLLYLVDIKKVLALEIRELHTSICASPNILFVGHLRELRWNNVLKPTLALLLEALALQSLLTKDLRPVANNLRILIEFPLHIDLEDWFVGLSYFCKREYIGVFDQTSVMAPPKRVVDLESTLDEPRAADPPDLDQFLRHHVRVSKRVTLDIIEAKFDPPPPSLAGKVYAEVVMWGYPWARTALVAHGGNPFWKEQFATDLPILTQMIHIVVKHTLGESHLPIDPIVGTVFLTPDILAQQLNRTSTMSVGGDTPASAADLNSTVRLSIYDASNCVVGKLLVTVDLSEYLIPPPGDFRALENMLVNCPMKELIGFCNATVGTSEFESASFMLLDVFQSLGVEDKWFRTLMDEELVMVDQVTRKNYQRKPALAASNMFNTLFRGSSIFTKSLERYILRIGHEYLEKVFGDFFERISAEQRSCEIDPRYVRQQLRRGSSDDSDDSDSDASDLDDKVQACVDENAQTLVAYTEEIWAKIYSTSNDLPQQIKSQLKSFRNKVDLACDPSDKVTALNCLSAFVFLRFFCPAILNPKLFYLTKTHQTGQVQRTLTLIAKVLLNLANRQQFSPHKEPHLVRMNDFLTAHENDILDYFDKITGRKNDFNEKVLELSHEMKRFDLALGADSASSELPTTPYLIDKYLRLTEFIYLLHLNTAKGLAKLPPSVSSASITTLDLSANRTANDRTPQADRTSDRRTLAERVSQRLSEGNALDSADDIRINEEGNVYQIGSLEFEKAEFLDLVGDNETEGFIKSLCRSNEQIFSFITSNITLKDLQKQSTNLVTQIQELCGQLQQAEVCSNLQGDPKLWETFVTNVVSRACLDTNKNTIVFYDQHFQDAMLPSQKRLNENALAALKLKFPVEYQGGDSVLIVESFSSSSLGSLMRGNSKNPFRRWLRRD